MSNDYLKHRLELKLNGPKPEGVKRAEKKATGVFFADQIAKAPANCENCNISLGTTKAVLPGAMIAHILRKSPTSGFPSVATHSHNRLYLCRDCHDKYDNGSTKEIRAMKCFHLAVERLKVFRPLIKEKKGLPKCFTGYVN